mmetsp:Transcript_23012/g.25575  ORF Transcript_23012/g.25575 Transcript_23012/m.25575 type:complete len:128 (+) Transcript_23012:137-520(+)
MPVPSSVIPHTDPNSINTLHRPVSHVMTPVKLQELLDQIHPGEKLDPEVEELLMVVADNFIDDLMAGAIGLAKHRASDNVDITDVKLYAETHYKLRVPGFNGAEPPQVAGRSDTHQQRLGSVNRAKR